MLGFSLKFTKIVGSWGFAPDPQHELTKNAAPDSLVRLSSWCTKALKRFHSN